MLRKKHPDCRVRFATALPDRERLPLFEDVEITGDTIQGRAGPGGCDASHWQDMLLRFGAHSEWLRDSVASLSRRLSNSIVPWSDVRVLMANRTIALDKCPGV